jgi:predicted AlkP superfamily pyrophosphatase or phosphodiesterase
VAPQPAVARHVVLVSIDGMRPDYYTHASSYGLAIPNLRALMQRGRYAEAVIGTWPTVTYPAHTTLVTGARPNRHGILANRPFDPTYKNQGGWNWYAESIKADTLWGALHRAGKTTGAVYWPVTVGAAIDDNFPQIWRAKVDEDDKLLRALISPGLAEAYAKAYGALPAEHRTDHERGNAAELLVRDRRHDLTLVYFTDLDEAQHEFGPGSKQAKDTLERIDGELGRVVRAIDAAGDSARTAVVVVSDHGFSPVKSVVRPAVLLREAGLIDVTPGGAVKSWRAGVVAAGGMAAIYLKDPDDAALREQVGKALGADDERRMSPGIRAVLPREASEREGGFAGAAFTLVAAPGFEFDGGLTGPVVGPSGDKGAHGYPPEDADMHASLIVAGSGIRPGPPLGRVSMLRIAPTVAALLGVTLADAETPPLAEVLSDSR